MNESTTPAVDSNEQGELRMAQQDERGLSRRERQIMDILYTKGQASALEVRDAMADPPSKTAVRTFLRILEEKGFLCHEQSGQTYLFRPKMPREHAGPSAFRRVLDVFFGGSLEQAVAAHLGGETEELTDEELKRLAGIIQKARKARKGANS